MHYITHVGSAKYLNPGDFYEIIKIIQTPLSVYSILRK